MAGKGPPPSGARARANDQRRDDAQKVELEVDDVLRGPELPERLVVWSPLTGEPIQLDWPGATTRWWASWRKSPQAATFTETDWDFLLDTALLHAKLWMGDTKAAAEVRLRVAAFGATPADRARLRMSIKTPGTSTSDAKPAQRPEDRAAAAASSTKSKRRGRILNLVTDGEAESTG